jgi:dihydrofolate reductase
MMSKREVAEVFDASTERAALVRFTRAISGAEHLDQLGRAFAAAYWPEHADEPFGDVMNSIKKYVVSNGLQTAEWENSEIISGDVAAEKLTDLKAQDGGDIAMSGSATTVRWLLREGLVDELNLLVHPIVVGEGLARLFATDGPSIPLELLSAETFKTGVQSLSYAPIKD